MLGLNLRTEFKNRRLKGTAIELSNNNETGATQVNAEDFLEITYPTHDLLKGIEAVGPGKGRPVVVIGERGLGKSHIMAALFHAVNDPDSTKQWLNKWGATLEDKAMGEIPLRSSMLVIGESLHRQRYKFLWDILFDRHPHGAYIKGKWEGMGEAKTDIPSDELILELLRHSPTMLLFDEFQTWFDGLTNTKQYPRRTWAFNFIQILSEIAKEHPDLLALVVSVRNGDTDAYQQIHRVNPVQLDFKAGGSSERIQSDRRRMLLHRLFENRLQIDDLAINQAVGVHVDEYFRLLDVPNSEHDRKRRDFVEAWPYAPHLLQLLEDQVLVASDAQETRDLIRILANLFKSRGEKTPVLTAADFRLDDESAGIGALLDSVANQQHRLLREKAHRNVVAVMEAVPSHSSKTPHLYDIMGALWLRSIAAGGIAGAEPNTLQADVTQSDAIDDNAFQVEVATVVENSFNIHQEGSRLVFKEEENPQAKLMATARNDKLFKDGSDQIQLAKEIRYVVGGSEDVARNYRVISLPKGWLNNPWSGVEDAERPENWDNRIPVLILPEEPDKIHARLGEWVKTHLQRGRNTVRFVVPSSNSTNVFYDRDLVILARAAMKAKEWAGQNTEYRKLQSKYQNELRDILKRRFSRFAVMKHWNFASPDQCEFHIEPLREAGSKIPQAISDTLVSDLFVPEDFYDLVQKAAIEHTSVGKFLRELQEPRAGGLDCIPWLGEPDMKERIVRACARGKIAIDLRGLEYLQAHAGEDEETAWKRLRSKLSYTGRQLDEVKLLPPSAVPSSGGTTPPVFVESITDPSSPIILGNDGSTPTGGSQSGSGDTVSENGNGEIFEDAITTQKVTLTAPATSPLNLIGKLEVWGIGPATPVTNITLSIGAASGAQIKELLRDLPAGMTFDLTVDKDQN